jgi:hypothetical protein
MREQMNRSVQQKETQMLIEDTDRDFKDAYDQLHRRPDGNSSGYHSTFSRASLSQLSGFSKLQKTQTEPSQSNAYGAPL